MEKTEKEKTEKEETEKKKTEKGETEKEETRKEDTEERQVEKQEMGQSKIEKAAAPKELQLEWKEGAGKHLGGDMVTDQCQLIKDVEKQPKDLKRKNCGHTRLEHYGNVIVN